MSNNIAGKIVVITGASSGLGEATARHLSALGAVIQIYPIALPSQILPKTSVKFMKLLFRLIRSREPWLSP